MLRTVAILLLSALPALAAERPVPSSKPPPAPIPPTLPSFELFRFPINFRISDAVRLESVVEPEKLTLRQPGDPDSVISPGSPTPSNQVALKPAFEVNDILLKAYRPDPTLDRTDNRRRGAGAFSPLDFGGRPYQLRLGARLVW